MEKKFLKKNEPRNESKTPVDYVAPLRNGALLFFLLFGFFFHHHHL